MTTTTPSPAAGEILIVEDSATQALLLQNILETNGFKAPITRNGREALAALASHRPTLVITDINMPEMDGYQLCQTIKDDPRWKEIPVILLTALSDPADILKGLECGADNFIAKPYEEEFLLSRVRYVLANLALRQQSKGGRATEIFFAGRKYQLTSDRIHSIDLLLSTYETAVQKNIELDKARLLLEQQAAQLRDKNEQMSADLELARELQNAFIPRHYPVFPSSASPERSAIHFCHRYTTTTELGGDFFDIHAISDTEAGVLLCDVMGHGVRAALVVSILRGLAEELKPLARDPGRFLTEINRSLCAILKQTLTHLFVTAVYGVVDVARGELRFANAGHPAPILLRQAAASFEVIQHEAQGPALGLMETSLYQSACVPIAPRDLIMLYTDGLYEIEGADGTFFDQEGLLDAIAPRMSLPAPQLFDELLAEVKRFSAAAQFEDDVCIVGINVTQLLSQP